MVGIERKREIANEIKMIDLKYKEMIEKKLRQNEIRKWNEYKIRINTQHVSKHKIQTDTIQIHATLDRSTRLCLCFRICDRICMRLLHT